MLRVIRHFVFLSVGYLIGASVYLVGKLTDCDLITGNKARIAVADTIPKVGSDTLIIFSGKWTLMGMDEPTERMPVERRFVDRLKSRLGPKTLSRFPSIAYEPKDSYTLDGSHYVVSSSDSLSANTIVLAGGERSSRYALYVLKHELGHWAHHKVIREADRKRLVTEFRDDQDVATFLGYELEKFANGLPSEIDTLLNR